MEITEIDKQFHGCLDLWLKEQIMTPDNNYEFTQVDKSCIFPIFGYTINDIEVPAYLFRADEKFMYSGHAYDIRFVFTCLGGEHGRHDHYEVFLISESETSEDVHKYLALLTGINDDLEKPERITGTVDFNGNVFFEHYPTIRKHAINLLKYCSNYEERAETLFNMIQEDRYQ